MSPTFSGSNNEPSKKLASNVCLRRRRLLTFDGLHSAISQTIELFITTAAGTAFFFLFFPPLSMRSRLTCLVTQFVDHAE
jgi:hypothetical protein